MPLTSYRANSRRDGGVGLAGRRIRCWGEIILIEMLWPYSKTRFPQPLVSRLANR